MYMMHMVGGGVVPVVFGVVLRMEVLVVVAAVREPTAVRRE